MPLLIILVLTLVAFRAMRPLAHRLITRVLERRAARHAAAADADAEVAAAHGRGEPQARHDARGPVATILKVTVLIVAILVILTIFDLLPVIAGLGLIAVALTLAGQSIVLDYLMGILIVLEGPYYKGDWVQIGGVEGEVEEVGMRRTVIRDGTGTVHSVSNGETRIASNLTRIFARMLVDVTVAYGTDIDRATAIVNDVGAAMLGRPGVERSPARGAVPAPRRCARRAGDDAAGGRQGPRLGPVRRAGRAPQAAPRRLPGERDRDRRAWPDGPEHEAPVCGRPRQSRTTPATESGAAMPDSGRPPSPRSRSRT